MNKPLVSFGQMVTNLFKADSHEFCTAATPLMHAAIGIMGEAIEFAYSTDTKNAHEEAGDMEFYFEAFIQQAKFGIANLDILTKARQELLDDLAEMGAIEDCLDAIIKHSSMILDLTKKAWVYHKDLDELRPLMARECGFLAGALLSVYAMVGFEHQDILQANQEKLAKRYPDGVYSNLHAQTRLDKQED